MSVLKFNPSTNKFNHGKVEIGDCNFVIPETSLPCTLATAFVDGEYKDTAPYFSTYAKGLAWVQSRILANKATRGNIIITSNQGDCDLVSNINIWIAPNVNINTIKALNVTDVYVDGYGDITNLNLYTCYETNIRTRIIGTASIMNGRNLKLEYDKAIDVTINKINGIDIICKGSGGSLTLDGESRVNLEGQNSIFDKITTNNNVNLRCKGCRVLGETISGDGGISDFQDCEFFNASGIALISQYQLSLTNCWVYSENDIGIKLYEKTDQGTTILNNTIIWAGGAYSVYDASGASTNALIYVYGNSCASADMYHCTSVVNNLVVNQGLAYKVY